MRSSWASMARNSSFCRFADWADSIARSGSRRPCSPRCRPSAAPPRSVNTPMRLCPRKNALRTSPSPETTGTDVGQRGVRGDAAQDVKLRRAEVVDEGQGGGRLRCEIRRRLRHRLARLGGSPVRLSPHGLRRPGHQDGPKGQRPARFEHKLRGRPEAATEGALREIQWYWSGREDSNRPVPRVSS